jgi:hypothetical protein
VSEPAAVRIVPRYRDGVARARCHQCDAELAVTGFDASGALENLHAQLRLHGWGLTADGRRLCPRHAQEPAP